MLKTELGKIISDSLEELSIKNCLFSASQTEDKKNGDYSTNAALVCGKRADLNSLELAGKIKNLIEKREEKMIERIEIAPPGFLNFFISPEAFSDKTIALNDSIDKPGKILKNERVNLEFISANPTGELHIGHGRGAFYGDILGNILSYAGAEVAREYFINDSKESNQIKELGKTAKGEGEQYKTEFTAELIKKEDFSDKSAEGAGFLLTEKIQEHNKNFLKNETNISFDSWYSEDEKLLVSGLSQKTLEELVARGLTYQKDGAVWLKTSECGDDEDRVVVRSDGSKTYFLSDITYHTDKFKRGFNKIIDVWGADHHGHVKRMMAVKKMLKWEGELLIFITQLVSIKEGSESKKMSKRLGNVILLKDLLDEFGLDVTRWFFAEKSINTHMEFDAALARERSAKNPVYYVEYAHARINSIIEKAKDCVPSERDSLTRLIAEEPSAKSLARAIALFPETIEEISKNYQVHKLCSYAYHLAEEFSGFYRDVKVIEENKYHPAALQIASITQKTLAKSLGLLGISAPEKM